MDEAHAAIETVLANKFIQMKAEESQRYGKLGNETEFLKVVES